MGKAKIEVFLSSTGSTKPRVITSQWASLHLLLIDVGDAYLILVLPVFVESLVD